MNLFRPLRDRSLRAQIFRDACFSFRCGGPLGCAPGDFLQRWLGPSRRFARDDIFFPSSCCAGPLRGAEAHFVGRRFSARLSHSDAGFRGRKPACFITVPLCGLKPAPASAHLPGAHAVNLFRPLRDRSLRAQIFRDACFSFRCGGPLGCAPGDFLHRWLGPSRRFARDDIFLLSSCCAGRSPFRGRSPLGTAVMPRCTTPGLKPATYPVA